MPGILPTNINSQYGLPGAGIIDKPTQVPNNGISATILPGGLPGNQSTASVPATPQGSNPANVGQNGAATVIAGGLAGTPVQSQAAQANPGGNSTGNWNPVPANEPLSNMPFDPRIKRLAQTTSGSIARNNASPDQVVVEQGIIKTQSPAPGYPQFSCYFLFNPTEIDLDYSISTGENGNLPPFWQNSDPSNSSNLQGLAMGLGISFTLLFDRTYEVWTGSNTNTYTANPSLGVNPQKGDYGPYTWGAAWDIFALERLLGIYGQTTNQPMTAAPAAQLLSIDFAGANFDTAAKKATAGKALSYASVWPLSLEVQYTRFDAAMVPVRAAAAMSFQIIWNNNQTPPSNNSPATNGTGTNGNNSGG